MVAILVNTSRDHLNYRFLEFPDFLEALTYYFKETFEIFFSNFRIRFSILEYASV